MAKARKKRGSTTRFVLGMILYALFFTVLVSVGLRLFWTYIDAYEKSRPNTAMEEYIHSFDDDHIRAISADFIASLDPGIQNKDESEAVVAQIMSDELYYARKGKESSEYKTVYVVSNEDRELGRVVLTKEPNPRFGFSPWHVAEESYDFSWLVGSDEITVPEDWTVYVGDLQLGADYVIEDRIPFDTLEEFYGDAEYDLPYLVTYGIDDYVGSAPFTVYNSAGEQIEVSRDWDEDYFLDTCTSEEKEAAAAFLEDFLPYYIQCLSNSNHNASTNYSRIQPYLVKGSDIDSRLYGAIAGQYYAHSRGDEIQSLTVNQTIDLGNGYYLIDFTYELDTLGQNGHVQTTNNAKVILLQTTGGLKAARIISY